MEGIGKDPKVYGRILLGVCSGFWQDSGEVLEGLRTDSERILEVMCNASGRMLEGLCKDSWMVLEGFCKDYGRLGKLLEGFWKHSGHY